MKNSRTRLAEYVGLFNRIDEVRLEVLDKLTAQIETGGGDDPAMTEILMADLEAVEDIADSVVNAIMENGELSGN
jgi:hypothetical protein